MLHLIIFRLTLPCAGDELGHRRARPVARHARHGRAVFRRDRRSHVGAESRVRCSFLGGLQFVAGVIAILQ